MNITFNLFTVLFFSLLITKCITEEVKEINNTPRQDNENLENEIPMLDPDNTNTTPQTPAEITDCDNLKFALNNYVEIDKNWENNTMNCCDDSRYICKMIDGKTYISEINLSFHHLNGTISNHFGNFTYLEKLNLNNNKFTGDIPEDLKYLTNLQYLYLNFNDLDGKFPSFIGDLKNLRVLDISNNEIKGTLPKSLSNLSYLEVFSASYNLISGEITDFFSSTPNITKMDLSLNRLEGEIPRSIGSLHNLTELHLNNNKLKGSIPSSFSNLVNLETLYLSFNDLSGPVPDMPKTLQLCGFKETNLCLKENAVCGLDSTPVCTINNNRFLLSIIIIIAGIIGLIALLKLLRMILKTSKRKRERAKQSDEELLTGEDDFEEGEFIELKEENNYNNRPNIVEVDEDYIFNPRNMNRFVN